MLVVDLIASYAYLVVVPVGGHGVEFCNACSGSKVVKVVGVAESPGFGSEGEGMGGT